MDNDKPTGAGVVESLADVLDEFTTARLAALGIPFGGRCWEIGAGSGSVACYLADAVGDSGLVLATDINPRHIPSYPGVRVRRHDVARDPMPEGLFDVIHARLLLAHLPERHELLARLVGALKPGGVLMVEEWGSIGQALVLSSPHPEAGRLLERYQWALLAVFASRGNDTSWCRQVPAAMVSAGLVGVHTDVFARTWAGGTAGCVLSVAVSTELEPLLVKNGVSADDLARLREVLSDPATLVLGNLTWSTSGHKPYRPGTPAVMRGAGPVASALTIAEVVRAHP